MSATATRYAFDADTRTEKTGEGEFTAAVTGRWNAVTGNANGGYLAALALNPLAQLLEFPDPLVASAFYLRPGAPGEACVRTEVVREGRRTATGESRVFQDGREAVRAVATFGDLGAAAGRTLELGAPPDLPAPDECVDPLEGIPMPGLTLLDQVEYRTREIPGSLRGEPSGDPAYEFWMRFRDGRDADTAALVFLVDAAAPAVMEAGEVSSATMELTVHVRARPAPGWLACRAATRHIAGGFHEEDMEIWDSAGTLVAQSRQFAVLL